MTQPTLSIVTVCLNAGATLEACILSIAEAKTPDVQYLVIDGGSTDSTPDILNRHASAIDIVVSEPDRGIFDAMNKGLALATGEYVAFLNADDVYLPDALKAALTVLRQPSHGVDVLYGDWVGVDAAGTRHRRLADHRSTWRYALCHQAVFARRAIFPQPVGFDTRYRLCADFDLLMRWRSEGRKFERLAKPTVCFSEAGASARFMRRSAMESTKIALRRARSLASLVFATRMGLFVARVAVRDWLAQRHQPVGPSLEGDVGRGAVRSDHIRIVVSAVNLVEGGTLTVLRQCLRSAAENLPPEWEVVALVHDTALIVEPRIRLVAIPDAKRSWLRRLYWEWWGFYRMSKANPPALWLSLHDITPRVVAGRQAVYCHNPSPFYRAGLREALLEPKFFLFNLFYATLYRVLIARNHAVVVQQSWLRDEFRRRMGAKIPLVVAHPVQPSMPVVVAPIPMPAGSFVFLYPALPRLFKNFETLCRAAQLLSDRGYGRFEVRLTLQGNENRTARWLRARFSQVPGVRLIGRQSEQGMRQQYSEASAVVFPSRLETWGLPISEAKACGLPLLLADLPYAREAVGSYDLVSFFAVTDAAALAEQMQSMLDGSWRPAGHRQPLPTEPFAPNWASLWSLLTLGMEQSSAVDQASRRRTLIEQKAE